MTSTAGEQTLFEFKISNPRHIILANGPLLGLDHRASVFYCHETSHLKCTWPPSATDTWNEAALHVARTHDQNPLFDPTSDPDSQNLTVILMSDFIWHYRKVTVQTLVREIPLAPVHWIPVLMCVYCYTFILYIICLVQSGLCLFDRQCWSKTIYPQDEIRCLASYVILPDGLDSITVSDW